MKPFRATASALIDAPPKLVYDILADYRDGHPLILPKNYFVSLDVEKGGVGAGTIISFQMRIFGKMQTFRAAITEPQPGRVLLESDLEGTASTTSFIVDARDQNRSCEVTIATERMAERSGLLGALERFLAISFLQRIYRAELTLLSELAVSKSRARAVQNVHAD
jgi:hypothetical protein